MRKNTAFALFEGTVIALYNMGSLHLAELDEIATVYEDAKPDIDDSQDTTTIIGQNIKEVCVSLVYPGWEPTKDDGSENTTPVQEQYHEQFQAICDNRWFW